MSFGDGNLARDAIDGARRGEDKILDSGIQSDIQERERRPDVILKILARILNGFADDGVSGEMHDGVHAFQRRSRCGGIAQVRLDQLESLGQKAMAGG